MGIKSIGLADALFPRYGNVYWGYCSFTPTAPFFTNEIVRFVDSGVGVVQRELKTLTESGLITTINIGNQRHYQANRNAPIFEELRGIMLKTAGLSDILRTALLPVSKKIQVAFIYGSIAVTLQHSQST